MTVLAHRVIAAIVVLIVSGLPVAGVLCARECVGPIAASASEPDSHCHEDVPADSDRIAASDTTACIPLAVIEAATVERGKHQLGSASPAPSSRQLHSAPPLSVSVAVVRTTASPGIGLSPGTHLPLRV